MQLDLKVGSITLNPCWLPLLYSVQGVNIWPMCCLSPLRGPLAGITDWPSDFVLLSPDKASEALSECFIKPLPTDQGWKISGKLLTNSNLMSTRNQDSYFHVLSEGLFWRRDSKTPSKGYQHFSNAGRKMSGLQVLLKEPGFSYWLFLPAMSRSFISPSSCLVSRHQKAHRVSSSSGLFSWFQNRT